MNSAETFNLQGETRLAYDKLWSAIDAENLAGSTFVAEAQKAYDAALASEAAAQKLLGGRVYRIPSENIADLERRVAKINKRAAKLDVEPITFIVTDETWDHARKDGEDTIITPHVYVIVSTNSVRLNGYIFAATIEHDTDGNIIRAVPGVEADLRAFRTVEPWCDHCKTIRRRIDTFVVLHEDGHTRQVGRNCLVDFLGSSASAAAQRAQWMIDFTDALESYEASGGFSSGERAFPTLEFLTHVALSIRESGWTSRGNAYEYGGRATADHASSNMVECRSKGYRAPRGVGRGADWHVLPTEADAAEAEAAIDWARETFCDKPLDERDDFEHNMAVVMSKEFLVYKRFGIAAYAVQGRRKAVEGEVRAKARAASDFIGEVKEKLTLNVTLARTVSIEGQYGTTSLYLFVDDAGNNVKWFSSRDVGLKDGESYALTGTVKGHEDHPQFGKSTILTRCKAA